VEADLLAAAEWSCRATPPGAIAIPDDLDERDWLAAMVPGTAAGAVGNTGNRDFDAEDWWFRTRFPGGPGGPWTLYLDGLATLAEVWLDRRLVLRTAGMFQPHRVDVPELGAENELAIRFLALGPVLAARHPRPRWRTQLVAQQHLRWYRTTYLGRMPGWSPEPAPVGPWRPVRLRPSNRLDVLDHRLRTSCAEDDGVVDLTLRLRGPVNHGTVRVGASSTSLHLRDDGDAVVAEATLRVPDVDRWWPHTHGPATEYEVTVEVDDHVAWKRRIGFRTIEVDRSDDGFRLVVNGVPIFCRGACWMPPDVVSLNAPADEVRRTLERARDAGMNMVRILGTTIWEDDTFWDLCDELGMLVWQDCMFANVDPPDDDGWLAMVEAELTAQLGALQGRPSLAVVCGGSEVQQQAAMVGLPGDGRTMPLFDTHLPKLLDGLGLDVPYVPSSPTGSDPPFRTDAGVAHYFGVGAYRRPLDDVRRADVRFAAESLAVAIPPEAGAVDAHFGAASVAGHHPIWKAAVPRDSGASWDFEDVRDHYVGELFGVDVVQLRSTEPERYLDLGRAAAAELAEAVFSEWRRPGSPCAGGLVLLLRDSRFGAGWGLLDAHGMPKAPWWALRRILQPVALLATDEGLNGLRLHAINDRPLELTATVTVEVFDAAGLRLERGERPIAVPARGGIEIDAEAVLNGFRDITYAYRFGPPAYDVVVASLRDDAGELLADAVHLVGGRARPVEPTIGLRARLVEGDDGWRAEVATERFAQRVVIEAPGLVAEDSWFHLAAGASRSVHLSGSIDQPPTGAVRALNATATARLVPA